MPIIGRVISDISALVEYKDLTIQTAVNGVIQKKLQNLDGDGGEVAFDKNMNLSWSAKDLRPLKNQEKFANS